MVEITQGDPTKLAEFLSRRELCSNEELFANFKMWAKEMDASGWTDLERGAIKGFLVVMTEETFKRGLVPRPKGQSQ
jgi:hypothetical protein